MKKNLPLISFLTVIIIILITYSCAKDKDSDNIEKEAIILDLNNEISADTLETFVTWMQGMGTRFALADNHRSIALKIRNRFKILGYSNARLDSFMIGKLYGGITYVQWQYNVIATLEGNIDPNSVCIIGAHYDNALKPGNGDPFSIVPGANDNASGVAATLEIARVMKKNNYSPGNTIEFVAFGSEELGLYGSYDYALKTYNNSKKIRMMLNNDMIAYQQGTNQAEWTVNIIDYANSHDLRGEAEQMCSRFTVLNYVNDNTYYKQSDSYPFFLYDFKALFFFSNNVDPDYHSLNDIEGNCNFEYCREIVKISCALLVDNS